MSQTAYNTNMTVAVAGMFADSAGNPKKVSTYKNPDAEIPFGLGVVKVAGQPDQVALPTGASTAASLLGIAHRDLTVELGQATLENAYPVESAVAVMSRGRIWVRAEEAVAPTDAVYMRIASPGAAPEAIGAFRNDVDGGDALLLTGCRFISYDATTGLAILEINLP